MLARRFTIICLVTAIFGMVFAMLVAQARSEVGGSVRTWLPCVLNGGFPCAPAR